MVRNMSGGGINIYILASFIENSMGPVDEDELAGLIDFA
jgi:hypothetical protein